jgi:S-adenosylmethionine:tRNA ribosyltransferase-isomerase
LAQEVEVRLAHRKNESVWEVLLVSEHVRVGDILHFSEALSADLIKESETHH